MTAIDRRSFLAASAVAAATPLLASFPRLALAEDARVAPAIITPKEAGKLRILAVTDVHFFWHPDKNPRTSAHLQYAAKKWQPDAIVVCGDLWMNNPEGKGLSYCKYAISEMEKLGLPWALARGNHDQVNPECNAEARALLTDAPHSLYRGAETLDCYRVEVRSAGADMPFWGLYLFNNAYPELHGFHQEQLDWFAAEAGKVRTLYGDLPAFAFFHIPLIEWQMMSDAGNARGVRQEPTTLREGSPGAFAALKRENQIRAMFCGHNHQDNYFGEYQGIHLEYLRATGQGGYGGMHVSKGATLIDLDTTGSAPVFTTATVQPGGRKFTYQHKASRWPFPPR